MLWSRFLKAFLFPMPRGLPFPDIDPVLIQLGPVALHWYGLAYIVGLLGGWAYMLRLVGGAQWPHKHFGRAACDDSLLWMTLAVIIGGRLGYVVFYNLEFFLAHPREIVAIWHGGMSFHGGLLGVIATAMILARAYKVPLLALGDLLAAVAPIGLFFGRLANFINAELWGRVTDMPWGVRFPNAGPLPRHPSQIYEALLEGLVLFLVVNYALHYRQAFMRRGMLSGIFLVGYAAARMGVAQWRAPDAHIGLVWNNTLGFWLSAPMLLLGAWLIWRAARTPHAKSA